MTPKPTGTVFATDHGHVLTIPRTLDGTAADVWASIAEPDRLATWFGTWDGEAAPGATVRLTMSFEEGAPPSDVLIVACEPGRHLAVRLDSWDLELHLAEAGGRTTVELTQHLAPGTSAGDIGPGWEYYLDRLVASREGGPIPDFDDYFPALQAHYERTEGDDEGPLGAGPPSGSAL